MSGKDTQFFLGLKSNSKKRFSFICFLKTNFVAAANQTALESNVNAVIGNVLCYNLFSRSYGTAGDKHSYQPDCVPFGKFLIDLTETPWVINEDMHWVWEGSFANGDTSTGSAVLYQHSKIFLEKMRKS